MALINEMDIINQVVERDFECIGDGVATVRKQSLKVSPIV